MCPLCLYGVFYENLLSNHPELLGRSRPAESGLSARAASRGRDDSGLALQRSAAPCSACSGKRMSISFATFSAMSKPALSVHCSPAASCWPGLRSAISADTVAHRRTPAACRCWFSCCSGSMRSFPSACMPSHLPHSSICRCAAVFRNALILLLARSGQNARRALVVAACTLLLVLTAPFLLPLVLFAHFSFCALVCLCFAEGGLRRCIAE